MNRTKLASLMTIVLLAASSASAETYRLIHAKGNAERVEASGLSKDECEQRKRQLEAITVSVGVGGSVTCIPESLLK